MVEGNLRKMSQLLSSAIVAICISAQGPYNEACNKGVEAGAKQTGIYQEVDWAEKATLKFANDKAEATLGKKPMSAVGVGVFVYRAAKNKKVNFKLPDIGVCDSITNELTPTSYNINLQWKF